MTVHLVVDIHRNRESDATNLQQFEGLLALTNVLSCGEREQDKLVAEK